MSRLTPGMTDEEHDAIEIKTDEYLGLLQTVVEYSWHDLQRPEFAEEIQGAMELFFRVGRDEDLDVESLKPIDHHNFMIWFLCDYTLKEHGMTPLHYLLENDYVEGLSPRLRKAAHDLAHSNLSLYEIFAVDPDDGIVTLRELFTLRSRRIRDNRLSRLLNSQMFLGLRLVPTDEEDISVGDLYVYPDELKEHILMAFKGSLTVPARRGLVRPSLGELLKTHGYLFSHLQITIRRAEGMKKENEEEEERKRKEAEEIARKEAEEKQKLDKKMEDQAWCRAVFMIEDRDKTVETLKGLDLLEPISGSEEEYDWYKSPQAKADGEKTGILKVTRRKLNVETTGQDNLEAAKSFIRKHLRGIVSHMYDNMEKRRSVIRG